MFVQLKDDVVKWVDFEKAELCLFEYDEVLYESLYELLCSFDDKALALRIQNIVLNYLNRHRAGLLISIDTLDLANGYSLQSALSEVEKLVGVKIDFFGAVNIQKFAGFSMELVSDSGVTSIKVPDCK